MKARPKSEAILRILRKRIEEGLPPPNSKMPGVRALAKDFQVATRTMVGILDLLQKEGLVARFPGKGVFVTARGGDESPVHTIIHPRKTRAEETADALASDIALGKMRVGNYLPAKKELQFRHPAAGRTLNAAIRILAQRGLLEKKGACYVTGKGAWANVLQKTRTCVVTGFFHLGKRISAPQRIYSEFYGAFANEIHNVAHIEHLDAPAIMHAHRMAVNPNWMGGLCILDPMRLAGRATTIEQRKQVLETFLRWGANSKLAFALFDFESLRRNLPESARLIRRPFFTFGRNDFEAGQETGTYLASLGHRSVVYHGFTGLQWSLQRFQGVIGGFEKLLDRRFTCRHFEAKFKNIIWKTKGEAIRQSALKKKFLGLYGGVALSDQLTPLKLETELFRLARTNEDALCMLPSFEKALAQEKNASAWVCADNGLSVAAINFLRRKGVAVPEEISVIGMDDSQGAALNSVTSHSFQIPQMGYLAAHCILGDIPIKRNRRGIVDVPGRIIERGSVQRRPS